MENSNRNKLIQELKNSSFLPPFNEELYKGCTQDHQKAIREIQDIYKLRNDEELSEKIKPIIQIKIKDVERTKRVQLAYLMFRINKIQAQYWQDSGELSDTHIENLSNGEKEYFKSFDQLIRKFENDMDTKVSQNISPPSDVFIEIRVKKEIGSIITRDGEELDLSEGNQLLVRSSDVIKFLQDGSITKL